MMALTDCGHIQLEALALPVDGVRVYIYRRTGYMPQSFESIALTGREVDELLDLLQVLKASRDRG